MATLDPLTGLPQADATTSVPSLNSAAPLPSSTPVTPALPTAAPAWNITPEQTVQGQVKNIIADNSPLMQQAETRSLQQMNGRGLINSSMAVGAGQSALYDAAMPMASADASTNARAAETNNAQRFDLAKMDKSQGFDLAKMDKTQGFDIDKMNKSFDQQTAQLTQKFGYDSALMKLQSDSARETANIQAKYRDLTQASSSAASLMNNASDHIHQIMMNENLDATAKQSAIDAYNGNLNKALMLTGSFAGDVDLSNMLSELLA
jgi:hypothetical protein